MATKKKNKRPVVISNHPATEFLNSMYHNTLKVLLMNVPDIYEKLDEIHKAGKDQRSPYTYITTNEVEDFILQHYKTKDPYLRQEIKNTAFLIAVGVGWKQYQQVYNFHPALLNELFNIDITDDKYATISKEEIPYLPCHNFYVEMPITIKDKSFMGFFVYFDMVNQMDQVNQIRVILLNDTMKQMERSPLNGYLTQLDYYVISLLYDYDKFSILSQDTGEIFDLDVEPKELLRIYNPNTFKELGDDGAMELLTHINQVITYLCATNADFSRTKKPTKKSDIKRTHITDAESEKWTLGARVYERYGRAPTVGIYSRTHEVENPYVNIIDKTEDSTDYITIEEENTTTRKTGYHVRPHMRRAHWKYYWYGKKDGSEERVKRRKFVSAVFINAQDEEFVLPTVEHIKYHF